MPSPPRIRCKTDMGWTGSGPWDFTSLQEPFLTSELARLSNPRSVTLTNDQRETIARVDSVSFQPCPDPEERNQDRLIGGQWDIGQQKWIYSAVLDGHGGHETVDYVHASLPSSLYEHLSKASAGDLTLDAVSSALSSSISSVDRRITDDILSLFPTEETLRKATMRETRQLMKDNQGALLRAMRGSTAILALVDGNKENLWVANLGDCQAVLGTKLASGGWKATVLTSLHNVSNLKEADRVLSEHPSEEPIQRNRIFGMLSPTRALGDVPFKLPPIYTTKLFLKSNPPYNLFISTAGFESLNQTPPYVSSVPEVKHIKLHTLSKENPVVNGDRCGVDRFLILCSDGLPDLMEGEPRWVVEIGAKIDEIDSRRLECKFGKNKNGEEPTSVQDNLALHILRKAIGGDNLEVSSRAITVEMPGRWMDDTTISVLIF